MKPVKVSVVVVGTGAFAQGLASLSVRSGADSSYDIRLASRKVPQGNVAVLPGLEESPVHAIEDVIGDCNMVVLAIPASGLAQFVSAHGSKLAGKVVLDVTNPWPSDLNKLGEVDTSSFDWTCDVEGCADQGKGKDVRAITEFSATSTAEWLQAVLPASNSVVKSFCNLSAYTLLHGDPFTDNLKSVAASDDSMAGAAVATFGRALGIEMRVAHSLSYARTLEARQHSLMPMWQWPTTLMFVTWLVVHIYSFIRYNHYGETPWQHVTMWITNKSVGWVSLWGMLYTYLPGVLVTYMQLVRRTPEVRLPKWMKSWMDARKQLGLLSLAAMTLHLLLSTFLWMPSYYAKLWDHTDATIVPMINGTKLDQFGMIKSPTSVPAGLQLVLNPLDSSNMTYQSSNATLLSTWPIAAPEGAPTAADTTTARPVELLSAVTNIITIRSKLNWIGESSTFLGIISGCLMGLTGLTSVPCITPKMNWREWRLLQSYSGWLAVVTATVHVLILGAPWWPKYATDWPKLIPTITLMSTLPMMLLLVLKLLLVLLITILPAKFRRSGVKSGGGKGCDYLASTPAFAVKH